MLRIQSFFNSLDMLRQRNPTDSRVWSLALFFWDCSLGLIDEFPNRRFFQVLVDQTAREALDNADVRWAR